MPLKLPPDARPQTGAPGHRQPRGRRQRQIPARARRQVSGQPLPATCSSPEGELRSPIVDAGPLHMHHRPRAASSRRQARLWVAREASARDEALAAPTRRGPPTSAIRWRRASGARWRESSKRSSASVGAGAPFRGIAKAPPEQAGEPKTSCVKPLGVFVCKEVPAEPGCRPGGTSPGSPWRPPHADGALRTRPE